MHADRGGQPPESTGRGQTAVLGIVLLIGMVAIVSVSMLLVASGTLTDAEGDAEQEQVEQAFVELSHSIASVTADGDVSQSLDLDAGDHGAVVKTNTSTVHVSGGDVNETIHIGTIEYEGDDGTKIAYQSGAVFHETGEETRLVSSPPIDFDEEAESLSFPIIKAKDDTDLNSGDITVEHSKTDPLNEANIVENDTVTVEITSEYYRGWETYFEQQAGPTTVQNVEAYENNESGTVTAEFGYLDAETSFETGATLSGDYDLGPGGSDTTEEDEDDIELGIKPGSHLELDDIIDEMIENKNTDENKGWAEGGSLDITGTESIEKDGEPPSGTYYAENINLNEELVVDLSKDNVTIVVENDVDIENSDLKVENWEQENGDSHELRIYTGGDIDIHNSDVCPNAPGESDCDTTNSAQLQIYGKSTTGLDLGGSGNTDLEGIFYLASTNYEDGYQVEFQSNLKFHGSIVASSIDFLSGIDYVGYDSTLEEEDIDLYPANYNLPPQLTYLNIAEHEVEIEDN